LLGKICFAINKKTPAPAGVFIKFISCGSYYGYRGNCRFGFDHADNGFVDRVGCDFVDIRPARYDHTVACVAGIAANNLLKQLKRTLPV
jgi:hypothetical protein